MEKRQQSFLWLSVLRTTRGDLWTLEHFLTINNQVLCFRCQMFQFDIYSTIFQCLFGEKQPKRVTMCFQCCPVCSIYTHTAIQTGLWNTPCREPKIKVLCFGEITGVFFCHLWNCPPPPTPSCMTDVYCCEISLYVYETAFHLAAVD